MEKTIKIEGMTCGHCQARVEKALNAIEGVTAKVNLSEKNATVVLSKEVSDETLMAAVNDVGYEAVAIQ